MTIFTCISCKHRDVFGNREPCRSCSYGTNFEAIDPLPFIRTDFSYGEDKDQMDARANFLKATRDHDLIFSSRLLDRGTCTATFVPKSAPPENNGHNGNYYSLYVANPMKADTPYTVECADVIESLRMDFNEGEAFKAIWRKAARRLGNEKQGSDDLYDAQKAAHYGARIEVMSKQAKGE